MVGRTNEKPRSGAGESTDRGRRAAGLAAYSVLIAVGAWVGALALVFGFLTLSAELEERLPFASPVFGGVALAVIVAAPATVVAALAWRGDRRTHLAAVIDGVLLIGWVVVQMAFIRELSYFHLIYATVGVSLIVWGRDAIRHAIWTAPRPEGRPSYLEFRIDAITYDRGTPGTGGAERALHNTPTRRRTR